MPLALRYGKTTKKAQMQDLNDGKTRRVASGSAATASPSFLNFFYRFFCVACACRQRAKRADLIDPRAPVLKRGFARPLRGSE